MGLVGIQADDVTFSTLLHVQEDNSFLSPFFSILYTKQVLL